MSLKYKISDFCLHFLVNSSDLLPRLFASQTSFRPKHLINYIWAIWYGFKKNFYLRRPDSGIEFPSITVTSSLILFCLWNRSCGPRLAVSPPNNCAEFLFGKNLLETPLPEDEATAVNMKGFIFIIPCIFSKLSSFFLAQDSLLSLFLLSWEILMQLYQPEPAPSQSIDRKNEQNHPKRVKKWP